MYPDTMHGVGATSKSYAFAAFKVSVTLNLAQRSFKVIHFGGTRKPVYDFIYRPLIVTFALSWTISEILPVLYAKSQFLHTALLFRLKFGGCCLLSRSVMLGSAERGKIRLISSDIIFQEFQPIWSRYLNVTDTQTDRRTDRRTDGQTTCRGNTAPCVASRVKNWSNQSVTLTSAGVHVSIVVLDRELVIRFCPGTKSVVVLSGFLLSGRLEWFRCDLQESVLLTHSVWRQFDEHIALKGQKDASDNVFNTKFFPIADRLLHLLSSAITITLKLKETIPLYKWPCTSNHNIEHSLYNQKNNVGSIVQKLSLIGSFLLLFHGNN